MIGVSRVHPPNKTVLRDISLSFFYGAKIGVLGLNGSGKSSLLRIIAGNDTGYKGEVHFSKGYSVGFLEQEPQLDQSKTVKEVVEEGAQEIVDLLNSLMKLIIVFLMFQMIMKWKNYLRNKQQFRKSLMPVMHGN
jgi:energy-dependent translational throttle protein EttA